MPDDGWAGNRVPNGPGYCRLVDPGRGGERDLPCQGGRGELCGVDRGAAAGPGVPTRTNQDQRDAIAAAMTARQHTLAMTETMGDIVVPAGRW